MYKCGWNGCEKAYGTLNHLNAHVTMQSHGQKRTPEGREPLHSCSPRDFSSITHKVLRAPPGEVNPPPSCVLVELWPHLVGCRGSTGLSESMPPPLPSSSFDNSFGT